MADKHFPVWLSGHDHLLTFMTEPEYWRRRKEIRERKPKKEQPLRLYLMRRVNMLLPAEVTRAWVEAWEAYDYKARAAYESVVAKHMPALTKLHFLEIPNSTWDGETIFSEGWEKHPKAAGLLTFMADKHVPVWVSGHDQEEE